ncbi:MAG: carbohydrate binding domain-containing protein [bacterium]|nr:carbohydrate binding domain-containing protein [bacterium]
MTSKRSAPHLTVIIFSLLFTVITVLILSQKPKINTADLSKSDISKAAEVNVIQNSSFESGSPPSNWSTQLNNGAQSTTTQDSSTKVSGAFSAKVNIVQSSSNYNVQFRQTVSITKGRIYNISFYAKASSNREVWFKINKVGTTSNHLDQNAQVTTSWAKYNYQFTALIDDPSAYYEFNVGTPGQIWFDDAVLSYTIATPPPDNATPLPTPTRIPTPTPIPTPRITPIPTPRPTNTPAPTFNPTPAPYSTPTPTPTYEPIETIVYGDDTTIEETPEFKAISISRNYIEAIFDKAISTGSKIYNPGFTITSKTATIWNIKYTNPVFGVGFEPVNAVTRPGQTSTVRSFVNSNKPNNTYTGNAILEYFSDNKWQTGPTLSYNYDVVGVSSQITSQKTPPPNTVTPIIIPTIADSVFSIISPKINQNFIAGQIMPIKWDIRSTESSVDTAIILQKDTGRSVNTISSKITSNNGTNSYDWTVPQIKPGDYKLTITTNNNKTALSDIFTLGSRLIIYASGTQSNNIYPQMQLYVKDKLTKTYFSVQGNPYDRQFAQFYYYSPVKITPNQIKLTYTNDNYTDQQNDRNLIVDRIEIDDTIFESESISKVMDPNQAAECRNDNSEWILCNSSTQF